MGKQIVPELATLRTLLPCGYGGTPGIPARGRLRQEGCRKLKVSLDYTARPCHKTATNCLPASYSPPGPVQAVLLRPAQSDKVNFTLTALESHRWSKQEGSQLHPQVSGTEETKWQSLSGRADL